MEDKVERPAFRFFSKKQYEEEISRILRESSLDDQVIEEQYEMLLSEYLMFCGEEATED